MSSNGFTPLFCNLEISLEIKIYPSGGNRVRLEALDRYLGSTVLPLTYLGGLAIIETSV